MTQSTLCLEDIHTKLRSGKKLTEKEIVFLIDEHWLEWTCKYELEPCGQLKHIGKLEYIQDNYQTIMELIDEFPEALTV
jgi:hypothetical protein